MRRTRILVRVERIRGQSNILLVYVILKASLPVVPFWITSGFEYYGMICLENPTSYPWQLGFENLGCGLTLLEDDVEADIEVEVEVEAACSWSCYPCRGRLAGP